MAQPSGRPPSVALQHLVTEARELHERLHRVAVALSITEDMLAETFEQLANNRGAPEEAHRTSARRARLTADECRAFARRLDSLHDA